MLYISSHPCYVHQLFILLDVLCIWPPHGPHFYASILTMKNFRSVNFQDLIQVFLCIIKWNISDHINNSVIGIVPRWCWDFTRLQEEHCWESHMTNLWVLITAKLHRLNLWTGFLLRSLIAFLEPTLSWVAQWNVH